MLTVDHYEIIRRKVRDGMSQRDVAKELGHSRNTVSKAVNNPIPPGYRLAQPRSRPAIEDNTGSNDEIAIKNPKKAKMIVQEDLIEIGTIEILEAVIQEEGVLGIEIL